MKERLLISALLSVSLVLTGCGQEEKGVDYSEFYREVDTEEIHLATEPLLIQEEAVTTLDGLLTIRLERESYGMDYFTVRINREWKVYADCTFTATWVTALGEDAKSHTAEFYFMSSGTEYLLEIPRSTYRYIRFELNAQPARVLANAVHSSVGVGEFFCLKDIRLKAEPVARSVVRISGLRDGNRVYVDLIRDGVVVDCGWAERNGNYPTKYNVDSISYLVVEGGGELADGGR